MMSAGAGFEETDIAVFRFTLGIPGFDDALIPRVVGVIGAALLVTNHLLDQSNATSAQVCHLADVMIARFLLQRDRHETAVMQFRSQLCV